MKRVVTVRFLCSALAALYGTVESRRVSDHASFRLTRMHPLEKIICVRYGLHNMIVLAERVFFQQNVVCTRRE